MTAGAGTNAGSLGDLQRAFQDYLLAESDRFAGSVRDTRKADRSTLLGVYRDAYALRLIEVLTVDYPGLLAMMGPERFDTVARAYITAHPSHHPSVRWFGGKLADFMAATPPYDTLPAAVEMARFEWTLGEAFDAADAEPITAADLMSLPPDAWETLSFAPVPSLRRLVLAFDVPQAWQQHEGQEAGTLEVPATAEPVAWVIWRRERMTHFRSLEPDEAVMLDRVVEGQTFPDLCESVVPHVGEDQAAARAAGLLRGWVEVGMLARFTS